MWPQGRKLRLETERLTLRLPQHADYLAWSGLRRDSEGFLQPWAPTWAAAHLSRRAFTNRDYWASRARRNGTALPVFLIRRSDQQLLGAITLDNIRRGPAQAGRRGGARSWPSGTPYLIVSVPVMFGCTEQTKAYVPGGSAGTAYVLESTPSKISPLKTSWPVGESLWIETLWVTAWSSLVNLIWKGWFAGASSDDLS